MCIWGPGNVDGVSVKCRVRAALLRSLGGGVKTVVAEAVKPGVKMPMETCGGRANLTVVEGRRCRWPCGSAELQCRIGDGFNMLWADHVEARVLKG